MEFFLTNCFYNKFSLTNEHRNNLITGLFWKTAYHLDHLEIANCYNLTIVFYPLGNFGQVLCIRSCHEDLILTRKSHNCAGIAFIQMDSAGGSKLIEHILLALRLPLNLNENGEIIKNP